MFAAAARRTGSRSAALTTLGGVAAAVVPFAIVVHLLAEAVALGPAAARPDFFERHLYLVPLLGLCAWWFAATVGLGRGRAEIARRSAMVRARLRGADGRFKLPALLLANAGFFTATQALEGMPVLSASPLILALCLTAAAAGSLLAALFVYRFGPSLLAAVLIVAAFVRRSVPAPRRAPAPAHDEARCAARTFTLFRPKRPPPRRSLA